GLKIRLDLELESYTASSGEEALSVLSYYPIKVLVTDQNMPGMTGTQLVWKVKDELGLRIHCIMLTGQSTAVDVQEAVNLGFSRFIKKSDAHSELPRAIRQAIELFDM